MPDEVELKLTLSPKNLRQLQALPWIRALSKRPASRQMLVSVYYDTEQFTLQKNGVSLRVRRIGDKWLQTIKGMGSGAPFTRLEWEESITSDRPSFAHAKGTPLEPLLNKTLRRDLKPVFETRVRRTAFLIQDGESKLEFAIDRGTINVGRRSQRISEVELELKKGNVAALCRVAERLSKAFPVRYGAKTKPERGYSLAAAREGEAASGKAIVLENDANIATAFQAIGFSCLRHLSANDDAVHKRDAEGVHQMRVGLRRLRAAMSIFGSILEDPQSERLKSDLKWLSKQLEPARDCDVFLVESVLPIQKLYPSCKEISTLEFVLRKKRAFAFAQAKDIVAGKRYRSLILRVALWLADGKWLTNSLALRDRQQEFPIAYIARKVLTRRTKKIVKKLQKLEQLDANSRHKLRIAVKKLRYATQFFDGLFHGSKEERVAFGKGLEKLQSVFDKLNDIRAHEDLADKIIHGQGFGRAERRDISLAIDLIAAKEQKSVKPLLVAATKAGRRLARMNPNWK